MRDPTTLRAERRRELAKAIDSGDIYVCLPFLLEAGYSARNALEHDELLCELLALPRVEIDPTTAEKKEAENSARDRARLLQNVAKVDQYNGREQINNVIPSVRLNSSDFSNVAHAPSGINETSCESVACSICQRARPERQTVSSRPPEEPLRVVLNCEIEDGSGIRH